MLVQSLLKISLLGATWVLYLLLFLSVVSIAATLERVLFFRKNKNAGKELDEGLKKALYADDYAGLKRVLEKSPTLEASILRDALRWRRGGPGPSVTGPDAARATRPDTARAEPAATTTRPARRCTSAT